MVRVVPVIDIFASSSGEFNIISSLFAIFHRRWHLAHSSLLSGHGLLEEGPVTNFVVLPYFHEDEAMLERPSDALKHLDRSPSPKRHVLKEIDLAGPEGLDAHETSGLKRSPAGVQEWLQVAVIETGVSLRG